MQSLLNKIDLLQVELSHFDVIALSETWSFQSIDDTDLKLLNYQSPFRKDRQTNNYGGVIVYVRDNIPCKRRPDLEVQGLESLWLELRLKSKVVLFGTFYRPPNSSNEILDKIEESIDLALDHDVADVVVTGDFNLNFLDNANRARIMSVFDQYSLYQLINEPTHYTETSSTLIDLLFTRNPEIISGVGEAFLDQNLRYHCPTYAVFNFDKPKYQCYKRKIWKYDDGDYGQLRQLIQEFNWQSLKNDDINVYAENVTNKILELCELAIPNKTITVRPSDPPWISGHIRRLIRRRKRAHRKAKRLDTPESWRKFRKLRNEANKAIKSANQDLKDKSANKLKSDNISSKDWWKTFKCLIGKDKTDPIPPLNHNGKQINDPTEKANAFNKYFHLQSQLNDRNKPVLNLAPSSNFLSSITVQKEEVCIILKSLATGKACGPDQISNRVLKEVAEAISEPLADLFNTSFLLSSVPDIWKRANLSPIHKKDDKTLVENHRPISLLSPIGKTQEKIVHKHVHNFLLENHVITPFQSGFIPGDSTVNQLVDLYNTFSRAPDEGKEVRVVFCDISKAFDRVWHKGLLAKLKHYGITGQLFAWFESYLSNRFQRVVLPGGVFRMAQN